MPALPSLPQPRRLAGPRPAPRRLPLAVPAVSVGLGVALGLGLGTTPASGLAALGVLATPLLLLGVIAPKARLIAWSLLLGLLLGRHGAVEHTPPPPLAGMELPAIHRVHGVVTDVSLPARGAQRFTLSLRAIGEPPVALARPYALPVTVRQRGRTRWRWHDLVPGSRISALARLAQRRDGIRAVVTDRRGITLHEVGRGLRPELAEARRKASWVFARRLNRRDAGLARALLLGDRGRLDRRDQDLFRATGQAHLLAVSGIHVGLLLAGLLLVVRFLGCPRPATWILGIATVALYVPFAGAPPSAIRAGLGAATWFVGALCARSPRGLAVLTLVGLIVLVSTPRSLQSVSSQLSFAAVASILLLCQRLRALFVAERPVVYGLTVPQRTPIRSSLAVSLAAWLGTAPFVATYIGRLCLASALIALPAIPIAAVLLGAGFTLLLGQDIDWVATSAAWCFSATAAVLRGWLTLTRDLSLHARDTQMPRTAWWVLYLGGFALVAWAGPRAMRAGLAILALLLLLLLLPMEFPGLSRAREARTAIRPAYHAPTQRMPSLPPLTPLEGLLPYSVLAVCLLGFGALAVRLRWLQPGAAVAAGLLGMAAAAVFGWGGLLALLAPFVVATLLGKLPGTERAGPRSVRQVFSNGLPALIGAALAFTGRPDLGAPFFLGGLACLGADTCATEIGVRYGGAPFRLAGRGPLASGDSGGVTRAGLLASVVGALLAPAAFALATGLAWEAVGLMTAAGVAGGLIDSLLGGTWQFRGRDPETGRETERPPSPSHPVERSRGLAWLDNDAVNLASGVAAALLAVALAALL